MSVKFQDYAFTTLDGAISAGAVTFEVVSSSSLPTLGAGDTTFLYIEEDVVEVTAITGTTCTCVGATVNSGHASGSTVELRMGADLLEKFATDEEVASDYVAKSSAITALEAGFYSRSYPLSLAREFTDPVYYSSTGNTIININIWIPEMARTPTVTIDNLSSFEIVDTRTNATSTGWTLYVFAISNILVQLYAMKSGDNTSSTYQMVSGSVGGTIEFDAT